MPGLRCNAFQKAPLTPSCRAASDAMRFRFLSLAIATEANAVGPLAIADGATRDATSDFWAASVEIACSTVLGDTRAMTLRSIATESALRQMVSFRPTSESRAPGSP